MKPHIVVEYQFPIGYWSVIQAASKLAWIILIGTHVLLE